MPASSTINPAAISIASAAFADSVPSVRSASYPSRPRPSTASNAAFASSVSVAVIVCVDCVSSTIALAKEAAVNVISGEVVPLLSISQTNFVQSN